jgi:hypothetical protein
MHYATSSKEVSTISVKNKCQLTLPHFIGNYPTQALKACGGMVDFKLTSSYLPTLFTVDGYLLVVMPMITTEASKQTKKDREMRTEPEVTEAIVKAAQK